jgi:hypothetical protein
LWERAPLVGDPRAAEAGDVDRPAIPDAVEIPAELVSVDRADRLHDRILSPRAAGVQRLR